MIARFVIASAAVLVFAACGATRSDVSFAQDAPPAPANAQFADSGAAGAAAPADAASPADPAPSADPAGAASAPAAAAAAAPAPVGVEASVFRIGPEDVLDVYVRNDRELNRVVPVRPDGKISLPLVNDVQAAGLTTDELRLQLMERFRKFFENPEVSVGLREMHSFKVSVQGNVRMPGQYEVKSQQTVLDLIARAQGFNEFADKGSIRILRRVDTRQDAIRFRYNDAVNGREGANFPVQPGDIIIVD